MLDEKTLIQRILDDELHEFINSKSISDISIEHPLDIQDTGAFLMDIKSTSDTFSELMSTDNLNYVSSFSSRDTDSYFNQLGSCIIKIDKNLSLHEAINTIYQVSESTPTFAGALLFLQSGGIINPLHPLVALSLIDGSHDIIFSKLLVFTYKDLNKINANYYTQKVDFTASINSLIKLYQSRVKERKLDVVDNEVNFNRKSIKQQYKVEKFPGENQTKEYYLVAHQLLTRGTFVPYYGTSVVSYNSTSNGISVSGFHLTPFKSCNISGHSDNNGNSVCTGGTPNTTFTGLRTLHHANLSSPYQLSCMNTVAKPYADACNAKSFDIYKLSQIIKEDTPNEEPEKHPEETAEDTSADSSSSVSVENCNLDIS